MSSLALAVMSRLAPSSLNQLSVLQNRNTWYTPMGTSSRNYAKSPEEILGLKKPKRPLNPYMIFANEMRPVLKSKNPDASFAELGKIAAKHWEQVGPDVKSKMVQEYKVNLEKYRKQEKKFEESLSDEQKAEIEKIKDEMVAKKEKRRIKAEFESHGRPKKPPSAYLLFLQSQTDCSISQVGMKEYQKRMKERWLALSQTEKDKWAKQAVDRMTKYKKDLIQWEDKMVAEGNVDLVSSTLKLKRKQNK